jgi:hypothetical protein
MSPFDFVFTLFGLLLGFTLVQLLSGFVRAIKATINDVPGEGAEPIRLGWLTPLLGLFVLLDVTSYWSNIWNVRALIPMGLDVLFGVLLLTSTYYFASSLVFPDQPREWPDFDRWFWLHRRQVLVCLFVVNLAWILVSKSQAPLLRSPGESIAIQLAYFLPLGVAALARSARVVGVALALLIILYLGLAAETLANRF